MKQLGYAVLFLMLVIVLIPFVLVRGCSQKDYIDDEVVPRETPVQEVQNTINVYVAEKDEVVRMDFNEYLKGVVAAEMPASFHPEALKAQAVAARTYVYHRLKNYDKDPGSKPAEHKGGDICTDPTHCKAWISKKDAMNKWGIFSANKYWSKISAAVDETANYIITYQEEPIDAVFHSTSSGRTENSEEVWANAIPYLRSVESEGEELSPKYISESDITLEEFKEKLINAKPGVKFTGDPGTYIEKIEKTEGGSVKTIRIGGCDFKGTEIRKIFELNSANFTIEIDSKKGKVTFHVKGNGHGVGMSQYGANYLAEQGKTFEEILKHYYKGVEIVKIDSFEN
ncbi:MAG: stage II sporulation protein D [Clostridiaceae bacterium]|nr:stage II sporulation protein D [Clostridiaceae bacterium]